MSNLTEKEKLELNLFKIDSAFTKQLEKLEKDKKVLEAKISKIEDRMKELLVEVKTAREKAVADSKEKQNSKQG